MVVLYHIMTMHVVIRVNTLSADGVNGTSQTLSIIYSEYVSRHAQGVSTVSATDWFVGELFPISDSETAIRDERDMCNEAEMLFNYCKCAQRVVLEMSQRFWYHGVQALVS
jgi:hypothetical protein